MIIKVMILDDEFIILDGLLSFPWKDYGCEVVATAKNGIEGLEILQNNKVDLILTDIRMPGMDGLAFSKRAKEIAPNVSVIIITGYDYFEYAKTAIKIGVQEFLLKPVDYEHMKETVETTVSKIREAKKEKENIQNLKQHFNKSLPQLKAKFTANLLLGRITSKHELLSQMESLGVQIDKYLICVGRKMDKSGHMVECDDWIEEFAYENISEEIFTEHGIYVLSDYNTAKTEYNFLLSFDKEKDAEQCTKMAKEACKKIQRIVTEYMDKCINFGISEVSTDIYQASVHYRNAQWACSQCIFLGMNISLRYEDLHQEEQEEFMLTEGEKTHFMLKLFQSDFENAEVELKSLFHDTTSDINDIKFAAMDLLFSCMRFPDSCAVNLDHKMKKWNVEALQEGIRQIAKCNSKEEILNSMMRGFALLVKQNTVSSDERNIQFANRIKKYIENNYMEDLSMELLSDEFHVSKTYISRLLKKYTGYSFLEYLTDVRFEHIERLMREKKYRQYEIAQMVGYHDFGYYIKVFKKRYGVTPNEYKKNM